MEDVIVKNGLKTEFVFEADDFFDFEELSQLKFELQVIVKDANDERKNSASEALQLSSETFLWTVIAIAQASLPATGDFCDDRFDCADCERMFVNPRL